MTDIYQSPLVKKAKEFAEKIHKDQKYGDKEYFYHLQEVAHFLLISGVTDPIIIASAYLHDCIEDQNVCPEEIEKEFGIEVKDIVISLTNEPGKNRKEKFQKTYPKLIKNKKAVLVKLADRLSNTANSIGSDKMYMYFEEYSDFRKALYLEDHEFIYKYFWKLLDGLYIFSMFKISSKK